MKMLSVWMTLLTFANYKDENGLKAGQVRISRDALAKAAYVSEKQVRTCIERLIEDGSLTKDSSRQGTVYTITNWKEYQCPNMDKSSDENGLEMGPTENDAEPFENEGFWQYEQEEKGQQPSKRANKRANETPKRGQQKGQQEINVEVLKYNSSTVTHEEKRANERADEIPKKGQQKGPFLKEDIKKDKKKGGSTARARAQHFPLPLPVIGVMKNANLAIVPASVERVNEWLEQYGEDQTIAAIEQAIKRDDGRGVSLAYVAAILRDENRQKGRQEEQSLYTVPRIRSGKIVS